MGNGICKTQLKTKLYKKKKKNLSRQMQITACDVVKRCYVSDLFQTMLLICVSHANEISNDVFLVVPENRESDSKWTCRKLTQTQVH